MFGLLHNCVIHPLCGMMWFIADTSGYRKLDVFAERLHNWSPKTVSK